MTRTREDDKEEVFSACIKPDDTRYLGGNKSSSVNAINYGWLKHANTKNLLYKIQSLTGVRYSNWDGKRTNIAKYYNKYVRIIQVINYAKYFRINFIRNGKAYYADSRDKILFYSIHRLNHFPITFKITKYDWRIYTKSKKEKVKPQT